MKWQRNLRLWFGMNWLKVVLACVGVVVFFMTSYGLYCFSHLESFYQEYMLAQMAVQLPMAVVHTTIFIFGYWFLLRNGMTKDNVAIPPERLKMTFSDVIGVDEAKEECMEVVHLIEDHQRIRRIGGKIVKGLLMLGPPGCGKTLLAKAIAAESQIPFLAMAGSEFNEMYVGVGASRVRRLFKNARRYAKIYGSCIVFIDEIDAIARGRQFAVGSGGGETNATQNQLLVEMDGLSGDSLGMQIIVIGATNAPISSLDDALLRPGRFDRKIMIDRPYADGRTDLFKYYLGKVKHDPSIDYRRLGNYTIGKSPADIENVVKEASLICTREKKKVVEFKDITSAIERIDLGQERKRKIHPIELERTAYHEAGHAILTYFLSPIDDVFKVSIATRGYTLGVSHHHPVAEINDETQEKYKAGISVCLGGYVAEKIVYDDTTHGCSNDFEKAMGAATSMVYAVGMGKSGFVGNYLMIKDHLSAKMKEQLNDDVVDILQQCLKEAETILTRERALMDKMVEKLLEQKTLEYHEVTDICKEYGVSKVRKIEERGLLQEFHASIGGSSLEDDLPISAKENGDQESLSSPEEETH